MALALERFQSASRTVRLTLPPGRHEKFWDRMVELAVQKQRGLAITVLLPSSPLNATPMFPALRALSELEKSGHEVGWSVNDGLPYSLLVIDDLWALIVTGDPDNDDKSGYVRLTDDIDEVRPLRDAFDRRVARGVGGLDPLALSKWIEQAPYRKRTRTAIAAIHRGERKLSASIRSELKKIPRRGFWIVKPHDSAYGMSEPPGQMHWANWIRSESVAVGFPLVASLFSEGAFPQKNLFVRKLREYYPIYRDATRAYATFRHFIRDMRPGDRVASMDGWTSSQTQPVRFHGWGRVEGESELNDELKAGWPLSRKCDWQRYEVEIPIVAVREATGLISCTFPIHRLDGHAFRSLVDLAEEVLRSVGQNQLSLELALMERLNSQQELL